MSGPQPERRTCVPVLGVAFDTMTRNDAALAVANLSRTGSRAYVVKPYSEFLPAANRDPRVNEILNGAALCLADGVGIIWAAHYLSLPGGTVRALIQLPLSLGAMVVRPSAIRDPLPEAMAGVDLTWRMLEALAAAGSSVFLLGGTEDELGSTVSVLRERLPDLRIVGAKAGHFRMKGPANDDVIAAINAASPDALLVAMGFPRQEKWISTNIARLDVKVAVAEGGSFSFIGGKVSRAPAWMRRAGLEWLYRLGRQPWRLRRQLQLPVFVWLVVRERLRRPAAA